MIQVDDLVIHPESREVRRNGAPVFLTAREYDVLVMLAENVNSVVSRDTLLGEIWQNCQPTSNVVDVYIGYLRRKIDVPTMRPLIRTIRGLGYMLAA